MRQRKMNEERTRRMEQSSRAYEKWREQSKNRPKPATQGLLRTFGEYNNNNNNAINNDLEKPTSAYDSFFSCCNWDLAQD